MRGRLEIESAELAESLRAAGAADQKHLAERLVERALSAQEPRLEVPIEAEPRDALIAGLDASDDEADFRRARAAASVRFLCEGAYEDAVYEAIHACPSTAGAVRDALESLR